MTVSKPAPPTPPSHPSSVPPAGPPVGSPVGPSSGSSVFLIALISAAAGSLLFLVAVGIFCICRKQRKTDQHVETREDDITYADATFNKRKAQNSRVKQEDDVT
ncbi:protein TRACHEARY ELEMENT DIFFERENTIATION-RELATED 7-like [Puntigrus tetrazona]|uniref:protein TRACHEARY ELEMENT DIFFERENTIATION-RELATED 7-like n=1 Tax=Puntigrus tetrazona TaxID=1606681 RepID=UPI001C8AFC14|nr:protein TRACHEARY ELEMENT DIFFERENTIATION-RELATED 7-like [Puntigrus tetrazona]